MLTAYYKITNGTLNQVENVTIIVGGKNVTIEYKDRITHIYKKVIRDPYALHVIETLEFDNRLLESQLHWQRVEHNHEREIIQNTAWTILLFIISILFLLWIGVIP